MQSLSKSVTVIIFSCSFFRASAFQFAHSCVPPFAGLDKIEYLQSHENIDVYHKAYEIIEQYFSTEEESSSKITPSIQTGPSGTEQFQFAPDQSVPMDGFNF